MKNTNARKNIIDTAMSTVWFSLSDDYELYLYSLTPAEEFNERRIVADAWKTLAENGLGMTEVQKHIDRLGATAPATVRFIDRARFAACEEDELPF